MSRDIERIPGNPWFICTLWLADWYIARATSPGELGRGLELLEWTARHALPSGVLAEQVHPESGEPLSVSPLSWSHGTFIATVLRYLERESRFATAGWPAYLAP
jgi:GH15 family glucan-1,4-alpha-glucosidase